MINIGRIAFQRSHIAAWSSLQHPLGPVAAHAMIQSQVRIFKDARGPVSGEELSISPYDYIIPDPDIYGFTQERIECMSEPIVRHRNANPPLHGMDTEEWQRIVVMSVRRQTGINIWGRDMSPELFSTLLHAPRLKATPTGTDLIRHFVGRIRSFIGF